MPRRLYPGPIEDGVQTYYGVGRDVPEGWGWRRYEGGYARWVSPDRVVQCHPPVEPKPPRTERVARHEAWGRKTPDGRTIGFVGRYSTGHVAIDAEGDPYVLSNPTRFDIVFQRRATTDIVDGLWHLSKGRHGRNTLTAMRTWVLTEEFRNSDLYLYVYLPGGFNTFFVDGNNLDFNESARQLYGNANCLAMYRTWVSFGDRHNWTERSWSGSACGWGSYFSLPGVGRSRAALGWP